MAHRHFEGKAHALLYSKYRPVPPKELIEKIINFVKEKYTGTLNLAVDVGCGSGQSTQLLAPYFTKVLGTDVSKAQIDEAVENNNFKNIKFEVSPAEKFPAQNSSIQLITASQAAHWFDLPTFYEEGKRALCPGGVMALYGYEFPRFQWNKDPTKNAKLYEALDHFYRTTLGDYVFPQSREVYLGKYTLPKYTISFATKPIRDDSFYHDMETRVSDIVHYCLTWSGYQNFCKINGDKAGAKLITKFQQRIMSILDVTTSPEETVFTKRTRYFLLLGRKPPGLL